MAIEAVDEQPTALSSPAGAGCGSAKSHANKTPAREGAVCLPLTADFWHRHQREPSTGVNHWGQRFSSVGDQVRSDTASRSTSSARCRALKLMVPDLFYPGRRLLFGSTNWIDGTIFQDFARPTVSEKTEDRHRGERTAAFAGLVEKYPATLPGNTVSESSQPEGARTENERVTEVERRRPPGW